MQILHQHFLAINDIYRSRQDHVASWSLETLIQGCSSSHNYNTTAPKSQNPILLILGDRCFATAGPTLWNRLPEQLRQPDITFRQFKRSFKTFMFG